MAEVKNYSGMHEFGLTESFLKILSLQVIFQYLKPIGFFNVCFIWGMLDTIYSIINSSVVVTVFIFRYSAYAKLSRIHTENWYDNVRGIPWF